MSTPQALIEGRLALPKLWPFDEVPPPFGSQGRTAPAAMRQAMIEKARRARRGQHSAAKHFFLYRQTPRRVDSSRFDAAMAEAKYYLDREKHKPDIRLSRGERITGAAIFVAGSIALAWLLATCVTHETVVAPAKIALANSVAQPVDVSVVAQASPMLSTITALRTLLDEHGLSEAIAPEPSAARGTVRQAEPGTERLNATRRVVAPPSGVGPTHKSPKHIEALLKLNRVTAAAGQAAWSSRQPENHAAAEAKQWRDWAAELSRTETTIRTQVPVEANWNKHMTQRRITDDPSAFQSGASNP